MVGGFKHPISVWIAYGFIHFAYLMVIATPLFTKKSSRAEILGAPISVISTAYFFIEFIVSMLFILAALDSYKLVLIVQIIITGIYAAILLYTLKANEQTGNELAKHESEVFFIKDAASRVKVLADRVSDPTLKKELEKAYDLLHSSPAKSHPAVKELESDILNTIRLLENSAAYSNEANVPTLTQRVISSTEERNRRLKLL